MLALACATTAALRTVEAAATRALTDWRSRREAMAGTAGGVIPLADGVVVKQQLPAGSHDMRGIRLATTTDDAVRAAARPVAWKLVRMAAPGGTNALVRSGSFTAGDIDAEGWIHIDFAPLADSAAARHLLKLVAPDDAGPRPVGLVLFHGRQPWSPPVVTSGPAATRAPAQPLPGTALRMRILDAATAPHGGGLP